MDSSKGTSKLENFWDIVSGGLLILVGGAGIVYDAIDRYNSVGTTNTSEQIIIFLIGFLCVGLGIERLLTLRKIRKSIDIAQDQRKEIHDQLKGISGAVGILQHEVDSVEKREDVLIDAVEGINKTELLLGTKEIDEAAQKLIESCSNNSKIKATAQYNTIDALPDAYYRKIADKLKKNTDMEYQVILPKLPKSAKPTKDPRKRVFELAKVADRVVTRRRDNPFPFEVLIAGRSMIIALLGGNKKSYALAVRITDQEFVGQATDWFRQEQWSNATPDE